MISVLITILIMCLVFGVIWWILTLIPLPAPFARIAQVVVALIFLIWLLYLLLPMANLGHPFVR